MTHLVERFTIKEATVWLQNQKVYNGCVTGGITNKDKNNTASMPMSSNKVQQFSSLISQLLIITINPTFTLNKCLKKAIS